MLSESSPEPGWPAGATTELPVAPRQSWRPTAILSGQVFTSRGWPPQRACQWRNRRQLLQRQGNTVRRATDGHGRRTRDERAHLHRRHGDRVPGHGRHRHRAPRCPVATSTFVCILVVRSLDAGTCVEMRTAHGASTASGGHGQGHRVVPAGTQPSECEDMEEMVEQRNIVVDWKRLWAGGLATAGVAALRVAGHSSLSRTAGHRHRRLGGRSRRDRHLRGELCPDSGSLCAGRDRAGSRSVADHSHTARVLLVDRGPAEAAAVVLPFTRGNDLAIQVSAAIINLLIGAAIGSLLSTVLSRTVFDRERSWQG